MKRSHPPVLACAALLLIFLPGCKVTRHQQVKAMSRSVGRELKIEQGAALGWNAANALRAPRLEQLDTMRFTWSAANVALGTVPRFVPAEHRPMAYDILEEVYGTLEWNLPKMPGDTSLRALPEAFSGGMLNLDGVSSQPILTPTETRTNPFLGFSDEGHEIIGCCGR